MPYGQLMPGTSCGKLARTEMRLLHHVRRGTQLDLLGDRPADAAAMRAWGGEHEVRAEVIRDVLRGRLIEADPRGLRLRGARVVGTVDLEGVSSSVILALLECHLPDGLIARDARLSVVKLCGCQVGETPGTAVDAARLVATMLVLRDAAVRGHGPDGAVDVRGARLVRLDCDGARLNNDTGPALHGDSLRVEHEIYLRHGFAARGSGADGAVCLRGAQMARLECDGAMLANPTGPALRADSMQVEQRAFLRGEHRGGTNGRRDFEAHGAGDLGAVRLNGARLGLMATDRATLRNPTGPALVAEAMQVERGVLCGGKFRAEGAGDTGVVRLTSTRIGGRMLFDASGLRHADGDGPLVAFEDLTYAGLPEGTSVQEWLRLLRDGTRAYAPQPYQQLALACRAAGREREAREVLIAQGRDELRRGQIPWTTKAWLRLTSWTLGYGYRPWLALVWLAAVAAVAVVLTTVAGAAGGLAHPGQSELCTTMERAAVGVDWSLPLLGTSVRDRCQPTAAVTGQWLTAAGWVLRLLGWGFGTLFVAGFTGAVRKTG